MREAGIALATAISAWINVFLLYAILKIRENVSLDSRLIKNGYKIIFCSVVMSGVCYFSNLILSSHLALHSTIFNFFELALIIVINQILYIAMIFMLKVLTIEELKGYIKKQ